MVNRLPPLDNEESPEDKPRMNSTELYDLLQDAYMKKWQAETTKDPADVRAYEEALNHPEFIRIQKETEAAIHSTYIPPSSLN